MSKTKAHRVKCFSTKKNMSLLHLGRAVIINDQRAINTMNGVESVKINDTNKTREFK